MLKYKIRPLHNSPHMATRMTRRDILSAIPGAFGLGALLRAQQATGAFSTIAMNHVTLAVTNAKRSQEFYQRLFGLPIVATQGPVPIMRLGSGPQFIALSERPTGKPGIDHVCLTIERFEVERVMKTLAGFGVTAAEPGFTGGLAGGPLRARVRMRGPEAGGAKEGTPEIYFADPDGITLQLQAPVYCGGAGLVGEVCSYPAPAGKPPLVTREMNHVTLAVSDSKRSLEFYQRVFGLPVVANQGPIPIMRVGRGPTFIALSLAGQANPRIDHVCVTIENFDPDRTMQTLADLGVKKAEGTAGGPLTARIRMRGPENGGAKEGTPELYFTDPDGITIQLQDVRYCGGAGRVGEICT
jgi:catechol 2,3-dioxygenase-like lactoylglutathione lyase family enzyme